MNSADICSLFNTSLGERYNTLLRDGFDEPFYKASTGSAPAEIQFRADYVASAMHEISHWCIAGKSRLLIDDYGYWYAPDGRDESQQIEFFKVEIKPQALEWLFCKAANREFRLSIDNLAAGQIDSSVFADNVVAQAKSYLRDGVPSRAGEWLEQLTIAMGGDWRNIDHYSQSKLV